MKAKINCLGFNETNGLHQPEPVIVDFGNMDTGLTPDELREVLVDFGMKFSEGIPYRMRHKMITVEITT